MIHAILPFCKQKPQPRAIDFLQKVMQAHSDAASKNMPASTQLAVIQGQLGMPMETAITAAINSIGGTHAPVTTTRTLWFYQLQALNHEQSAWKDALREVVASGQKIPGFGHSIHKNGIAPELKAADDSLRAQFPLAAAFLDDATAIVQEKHPSLFPNMALYTALACELVQLQFGVESMIFILSRLPIWAGAWVNAMAGGKPKEA